MSHDDPRHFPGSPLVARAARLVPLRRRAAWRREWEAEATYAWQRMNRDGPPRRGQVLRLRLRILTCVIDALWEKKETMTMTGLSSTTYATRCVA